MENTSPRVSPLYCSFLAWSSELFSTPAAARGCKVNFVLAAGLTWLLGALDPKKKNSPPVQTAGITLVLTSPGFGNGGRDTQFHKNTEKEKESGDLHCDLHPP